MSSNCPEFPSGQVAIELEGVSKRYRLYSDRRDRLWAALNLFGTRRSQEFWALRDVTLRFEKGESIGILGVNGSGKSTLLQIICGVLRPTTGRCHVEGRVAALLELGAGFNPDLTGRENVITNAIIMGLQMSQIEARLSEVEAFADIGAFFDQPVKSYSSGMFMRVAFAMSICVNPDILIIDEALAVGDAKFQEKCFRRIRELQEAGTTILFVTHDRASVTQICTEAVLLDRGTLVAQGDPKEIVSLYTELLTTGALPSFAKKDSPATPVRKAKSIERSAQQDRLESFLQDFSQDDRLSRHPLYNKNEARFGNDGAMIADALLFADNEINPGHILGGETLDVYVKVSYLVPHSEPLLGFTISNAQGVVVYSTHSGWTGASLQSADAGSVRHYKVSLPLALTAGDWFVELAVAQTQWQISDQRARALHLLVGRSRMAQGLVDLGAEITDIAPPPGGVPTQAGAEKARTDHAG